MQRTRPIVVARNKTKNGCVFCVVIVFVLLFITEYSALNVSHYSSRTSNTNLSCLAINYASARVLCVCVLSDAHEKHQREPNVSTTLPGGRRDCAQTTHVNNVSGGCLSWHGSARTHPWAMRPCVCVMCERVSKLRLLLLLLLQPMRGSCVCALTHTVQAAKHKHIALTWGAYRFYPASSEAHTRIRTYAHPDAHTHTHSYTCVHGGGSYNDDDDDDDRRRRLGHQPCQRHNTPTSPACLPR